MPFLQVLLVLCSYMYLTYFVDYMVYLFIIIFGNSYIKWELGFSLLFIPPYLPLIIRIITGVFNVITPFT